MSEPRCPRRSIGQCGFRIGQSSPARARRVFELRRLSVPNYIARRLACDLGMVSAGFWPQASVIALMTLRYGLCFGLGFLAFLGACGSSSSSAASGAQGIGGADGTPSPAASAGGSSKSATAAGSSSVAAQGGGTGEAGAASVAPETWNSARSTTITDDQLQSEYDAWKSAYVETCANGSSIVLKDGGVLSEGIGYGMLLSAAMADQPLFDGLWKYYHDHLDKNGLMNGTTGNCDPPGDNAAGTATDGDLDSAMALVQASARWPSAGYLAKAQALTSKIVQFETDMCSGRTVLRPGDSFGGCSDPSDQRINPSYFAPGYYKVFAHYFPGQATTWTALTDGAYQLYAIYQARMDNLVPDWSGPDGSDNGSQYSDDACRTPWRVAVDYGWSGDTRAKTFMQNISSWVDAHGGLPTAAQEQNSAFVGAFALAGGFEQGKFDGYVSDWLSAHLGDGFYYPGTLRVLYLLVATGKSSSTL
jgi:endo-1,4-beta-D-glucanase Y